MRIRLPLLALFFIAGRSRAPNHDAEWLVGRWAVDGETCQNAWLSYRADGTWTTALLKGTWEMRGGRLALAHTHSSRYPLAPYRPVENPLCHTESVQRTSGNELTTVWEDGSAHRLQRCAPLEVPPSAAACIGDCNRVTPFDDGLGSDGRPPAATRSCR